MARQFQIAIPFLILLIALLSLPSHAAPDRGTLIEQVTGGGVEESVCSRTTGPPAACPVNCFRADPVCGVDGVTYWCGCQDATCRGARVAKVGPCEVGSGGSASLPGQALLLVHIVWLVLLGFSLLFGLF